MHAVPCGTKAPPSVQQDFTTAGSQRPQVCGHRTVILYTLTWPLHHPFAASTAHVNVSPLVGSFNQAVGDSSSAHNVEVDVTTPSVATCPTVSAPGVHSLPWSSMQLIQKLQLVLPRPAHSHSSPASLETTPSPHAGSDATTNEPPHLRLNALSTWRHTSSFRYFVLNCSSPL